MKNRSISWISSIDECNEEALMKLQEKMKSYYHEQQYYSDITPGTRLWSNLENEPIHKDIVEQIVGRKVLEVGCGAAEILSTEKVKFSDYSGCDFSEDLLRQNTSKFPGANFVKLDDARKLPFDDASFDAVFSVFVLEHAVFPADFLSETHRVLRPGGKWIVLCPDFLGCDRMTSQRIGYSLGSGREKLKKGRLLDAVMTSYDNRVRIVNHCRRLKKEIGKGYRFYVNTNPVCFDEHVFRPDVDAVYLTYAKEIISFLGDNVRFLDLEEKIRTEVEGRRLIYLVGKKND